MADEFARDLRLNLTDAERRLWSRLRQRRIDGHRFRRQVRLGPFIVDFACFEPLLIVEVDGGQHVENERADAERTAWLEAGGFRVIRFWNNDVLSNTNGVVEAIREALHALSHPPPQPSPTRPSTGSG